MRLSDLGEYKIVNRMRKFLPIGDDAACIKHGGEFLVLTVDTLYEDTDLPPGITYEEIGKLIVTVNLSDLAAMGARPKAFLLSFGGPDLRWDELKAIILEVKKQCKKFGMEFIGGDLNSMEKLTLAGFALGIAKRPIYRSGAKEGELVACTGTIGAALGIEILCKNLMNPKKIPSILRKKAMEPEPRVKEGIILGKYASAMTDISDSLAISLHDIAESSGVGIELYPEKIPISRKAESIATKLKLNLMDYALYGGWDYELLFTIPEDRFSRIKKKITATEIGRVVKGRKVRALGGDIERKGYEHFGK